MPTFSLSPDQQQAMTTFRWLYTHNASYRRSGRTFVIALGSLQRLLLNQPEWVDLEDHYQGNTWRQRNTHLLHLIRGLATDVGCEQGLEEQRGMLRITPRFQVTNAMIEAVTCFGSRSHIDHGPDPILERLQPVFGARKVPLVPTKTIWEHLNEND